MGSLLPPFSVDVPRLAHPLQHSREAEDAEISKKLKYPGIIKIELHCSIRLPAELARLALRTEPGMERAMNWLNEMLQNDPDPQESREWIESLKAVIDHDGPQRAHHLLEGMVEMTRRAGAHMPFAPTTAYINTIPPHLEPMMPGDAHLEWRLRSIIRWNAMAMVVRANRKPGSLGGHIASFASSATLYDVGFNHFWRAPSDQHPGDLLYIQGHSSPGIYSRAFMEGRISEDQLENFRMEVDGRGISSYPHPWLMPDFWQTPTVSMGLGPIMKKPCRPVPLPAWRQRHTMVLPSGLN